MVSLGFTFTNPPDDKQKKKRTDCSYVWYDTTKHQNVHDTKIRARAHERNPSAS